MIIPDLEQLTEEVNVGSTKKVPIIKHKDGAGPHQNRAYISYMNEEFNRRDRLIFNQTSKSLVLNTCNACYFLEASKAVSKEQGLSFGGKLLQGEELFRLVKKVYE